jgi:hypothetical protein
VARGGLYVVERVKRGIYSLSKLARWVSEGNLVVAAKGWHRTSPAVVDAMAVDEPRITGDDSDWWQLAQIEEPELGAGEQPDGLSIALVFGLSDPDMDTSDEPPSLSVLEHVSQPVVPLKGFDAAAGDLLSLSNAQELGDIVEAMHVDEVEPNVVDLQQSAEELLDGMRDHYLQALYVSKVTLRLIF